MLLYTFFLIFFLFYRNLENRPELNANEFFRQLQKFLILQDAEGLLKAMFNTCVKLVQEDNRAGQKSSHQLRLMANLALFLRYHRQETHGNNDAVDDPVNYIGKPPSSLMYFIIIPIQFEFYLFIFSFNFNGHVLRIAYVSTPEYA